MGIHLVGYARVSTLDQKSELQLDALKACGCGKVFVERASGAKEDRLQLSAALDCLRSGDTLVVWKLDRLARSMKQLIETVDQLKARGIGLRSLTEAIDTTTAAGELFFHIFGALAQFERSIIRERTNAGLKAAIARGRKGGRRPKVKADDIRAALALLKDPEISVRNAAKRLGLSVSTLYRHAPGLRARVGEKV
jgi:DNA invertase Pin-like site-specific DNA recombinase